MIQGTALRHRVLAANLANAETPEYQAQDVSFSAVLDDATRAGTGAGPAVVGCDPRSRPMQTRRCAEMVARWILIGKW